MFSMEEGRDLSFHLSFIFWAVNHKLISCATSFNIDLVQRLCTHTLSFSQRERERRELGAEIGLEAASETLRAFC